MFPPPKGRHLTAAQAAELDDSYFQSRPFGYFSSRVGSLISDNHVESDQAPNDLGAGFAAVLGQTSLSHLLTFDDSDRKLQIATDAFALRHHAAESLVRLYHGLAVVRPSQASVQCLWSAIAEGPNKTIDLVSSAKPYFMTAEGQDGFGSLVIPEAVATQHQGDPEINVALSVIASWLLHAMNLLSRSDIDINAAHNKVKHGLAIRTRDDLLLQFTTQGPNAEGNMPLSALSGSEPVSIFDGMTLDFLSKPPPQEGRKQGLEVSSLKLVPTTLLAETWLMSVAHAAMFHVAASRYFSDRSVSIQPYPRLPLGPTPEKLPGNSVVGMRHPATNPPDGGQLDRGTGIAFQRHFLPLEVTLIGSGKIIDG